MPQHTFAIEEFNAGASLEAESLLLAGDSAKDHRTALSKFGQRRQRCDHGGL
jgi:hypothetical protein